MVYHILTSSQDTSATNRTIIAICEGMSEYAYFQELNRVFEDENIPLRFVARQADSGHYTSVYSKYTSERKNNPKSEIIIVVDYDIYQNNQSNNRDKYIKKPKRIPDFKFNYQNYEDASVLYLSKNDIRKWQAVCEKYNHFSNPISSDKHFELFKNTMLNSYNKGDFPFKEFNINTVVNAINNNTSDTKIHSDFLDYLKDVLIEMNIVTES